MRDCIFTIIVLILQIFGSIFILKIAFQLKKFYLDYIRYRFLGFRSSKIDKCHKILITGSTSGVGWKLAELLSNLGKNIICHG